VTTQLANLLLGAFIFGAALALGGAWFWACAHLTQAWYDQKKIHMPRWLLLTLTFGYTTAESGKWKERSLSGSGWLRWFGYALGLALPLFVLATTAWRFFSRQVRADVALEEIVLGVVTLGLWLAFTALIRRSVEA